MTAPHIIHIIDALRNNQRIEAKEKQEEEQRRIRERQVDEQRRDLERRNLEQWKTDYGIQINKAFDKEKQYSLLYSLLVEHGYGEQGEKAEFVKEEFLTYFNRIEGWTLDELLTRNFSNAATGLKILHLLEPTTNQYKTACDLLENPALLISAMQKHGLSRDSKYVEDFTYTVVSNAQTGAMATKSLI